MTPSQLLARETFVNEIAARNWHEQIPAVAADLVDPGHRHGLAKSPFEVLMQEHSSVTGPRSAAIRAMLKNVPDLIEVDGGKFEPWLPILMTQFSENLFTQDLDRSICDVPEMNAIFSRQFKSLGVDKTTLTSIENLHKTQPLDHLVDFIAFNHVSNINFDWYGFAKDNNEKCMKECFNHPDIGVNSIALMKSGMRGIRALRVLTDDDIPPKMQYIKTNPLVFEIFIGNYEDAKFLLGSGANPYGCNMVFEAVEYSFQEILNLREKLDLKSVVKYDNEPNRKRIDGFHSLLNALQSVKARDMAKNILDEMIPEPPRLAL